MKVATIIITRNRREILKKCIEANIKQTFSPFIIVIIDNASNDGTDEMMKEVYLKRDNIFYVRLRENFGSAYAFRIGMKFAIEKKSDYMWLMDDDCIPDKDSLENIIKIAKRNPNRIYGSYSVDPDNLESKWVRIDEKRDITFTYSLPFNGFFVSEKIVKKIGYPESILFFRNDDTEYSFRARYYGYSLFVVNNSLIYHPAPEVKRIKIIKTIVQCYRDNSLKKIYYSSRNFIAVYLAYREFLGVSVFFYRISSFFLNMIFDIMTSKKEIIEKIKIYFKAIKEGIRLRYEISNNIIKEG